MESTAGDLLTLNRLFNAVQGSDPNQSLGARGAVSETDRIGANQTDDQGVFESKHGQDLDWVWPPNHPTEERRLF